MKSGERKRGQKAELTDLEKADCLTGKAMGGIVLKAPGHGEGKKKRCATPSNLFLHSITLGIWD